MALESEILATSGLINPMSKMLTLIGQIFFKRPFLHEKMVLEVSDFLTFPNASLTLGMILVDSAPSRSPALLGLILNSNQIKFPSK